MFKEKCLVYSSNESLDEDQVHKNDNNKLILFMTENTSGK